MRTFKLKKCNFIHGLHFTPIEGELLLLAGVEAAGVDSAILLHLASELPIWIEPLSVDHTTITGDHSRMVVTCNVYQQSALTNLVRWTDPNRVLFNWRSVDVGATWLTSTSAFVATAPAIFPDGNRLLVGLGRQRFRGNSGEWSFSLAECLLAPPGPPKVVEVPSPIVWLAIAPDGGRWAASCVLDGRPSIGLFDRLGGPSLAQFRTPGRRNCATQLAFTADGRHLVAAEGRAVFVLAADQLTLTAKLTGHNGQVRGVALSPDGHHLLTASSDGVVRVWEVETGVLVKMYDWQIGPIRAATFSPDGLLCAAAGTRGQLVIWDADG